MYQLCPDCRVKGDENEPLGSLFVYQVSRRGPNGARKAPGSERRMIRPIPRSRPSMRRRLGPEAAGVRSNSRPFGPEDAPRNRRVALGECHFDA